MEKNGKMQSETITMNPEMPLLERLSTYASSNAYPFHMPGHKRQVKMGITSFPNPFSVDITEIDGFDNLHHAEAILKDSMESAAVVYGADRSWYLVNGSTCGILASISASVKSGEKILMARNSHKAAYHAVVLNHLEPVYLYPEDVANFHIPGGIMPKQVENALSENPDIRTVFITSPTYEGIVSDIRGIAEVAHKHGAALIVDEAHGAHLPFTDGGYFPEGALKEGADLVIQSLHKTLPSLTQTAILHLKSNILDERKVEQYLSFYESSSPSYILIASMENCVRYMSENGLNEMNLYAKRLKKLRDELERLKHIRLLTEKICGKAGIYGYDPSKIVIFPKKMTGTELADVLRGEYHLEPEMASGRYVLLMTSFMDTEEGFSRLTRAMFELDERIEKMLTDSYKNEENSENTNSDTREEKLENTKEDSWLKTVKQAELEQFNKEQLNYGVNQEKDLQNHPYRVYLPWQAWQRDGVLVPIYEAKGRTARTCVTIYPPGVPMLMPGEIITENEIVRIHEALRLGLTVEGISNKNADELVPYVEVII